MQNRLHMVLQNDKVIDKNMTDYYYYYDKKMQKRATDFQKKTVMKCKVSY